MTKKPKRTEAQQVGYKNLFVRANIIYYRADCNSKRAWLGLKVQMRTASAVIATLIVAGTANADTTHLVCVLKHEDGRTREVRLALDESTQSVVSEDRAAYRSSGELGLPIRSWRLGTIRRTA